MLHCCTENQPMAQVLLHNRLSLNVTLPLGENTTGYIFKIGTQKGLWVCYNNSREA